MDSESGAFEAFLELAPAGTPLRCPRPMTAHPIQVWTAGRIAAALFTLLVSRPVVLAPALSRRRA